MSQSNLDESPELAESDTIQESLEISADEIVAQEDPQPTSVSEVDLNASPTTSDEPSLNLEPTEGDGLDNAVEVEVPQDELNESIARIASTHTPLSNGILCQAAGQMAVSAPVSLIELGRFDETEETEAQKNSDNVAADYRTSDDCTFQSALTRMIDSPEPPISTSYKFTNIAFTDDNGEDQIEHQRIVDVVTVLSRSGSRETLEEQELDPIKAKNMALIKEEVDHVELLRPSTPTKADLAAVHPDVHSLADPLTASKQNSSTEEHTESQETPVPVVEAVPEPPEFDRAEVTARIRANLELKDRYKAKNVALQARLAEYFRKRRAEDNRDTDKSAADQEARYTSCMTQIQAIRSEYDALHSNNEKIVVDLKAKLEEKLLEASTKSDEFIAFRRETASGAENSRTGKTFTHSAIDQLEATEAKKVSEVIAVRLENIKLRNKLKRHEQLLRQKEELADGLHLIDFEQLKIENQTFNEKIEERNEELLKLRKKITNVVQVLTHVKEKLHFVQDENTSLKQELIVLDEQVSALRDSLPSAKGERDVLRLKNQNLRDRNGLLGNVPLLRDFEDKMTISKGLRSQIDSLKETYRQLNRESRLLKRKMQKADWIASMRQEA